MTEALPRVRATDAAQALVAELQRQHGEIHTGFRRQPTAHLDASLAMLI